MYCRFEVNNRSINKIHIVTTFCSTCAEQAEEINNYKRTCFQNVGPILLGTYYIVDHESGNGQREGEGR